MVRSYKRYRVDGFPQLEVGKEIHTQHQMGIRFPDDPQDDQLHSRIKLLGESTHPDFLKYLVEHEVIRELPHRFANIIREKLIAIERMTLYQHVREPYIYFLGKSAYSDQFLKRLAAETKELHAYERQIDLRRLCREIEGKVTGGWFKDLKIADVRTAIIFGERVIESSDWGRYDELGTMGSIIIELSMGNGGMSIRLFNDGGVVIFNAQDEREDLDSLMQLDQMFADFVVRDDVAFTL
jgi:hypothetical protein